MDIFDGRYYSINKRFLCILGQWPYQPILERCVITIVIIMIIGSLIGPQTWKLCQSWNDINLVIETVSSLITNFLCVTKFINCIINTQKIKRLLDETKNNWEYARFLPDSEILVKYGEKGRRLTIFYFIYLTISVGSWIMMPLLPIFADLVLPLNESRPRVPLFHTEYGIDQSEHFFLIHCIASVSITMSILIVATVDSLYMSISQHACGLFEILSNSLENIRREDFKSNLCLNPKPSEDVDYQLLVACFKKHNNVIEYIRLIESSCERSLILILILNMIIISFSGAQTVAISSTAKGDAVRFGIITMGQLIHLYCNSLSGQWIINSSSRIRDSAYNCKWYMMSLRSRRLVVLLLRRCKEPCTITVGKLYVMSIENFCSVLQTSMSYFTLLTSLQ